MLHRQLLASDFHRHFCQLADCHHLFRADVDRAREIRLHQLADTIQTFIDVGTGKVRIMVQIELVVVPKTNENACAETSRRPSGPISSRRPVMLTPTPLKPTSADLTSLAMFLDSDLSKQRLYSALKYSMTPISRISGEDLPNYDRRQEVQNCSRVYPASR